MDRYKDTFSVMKKYNAARFCLEHTEDKRIRKDTARKIRHIDEALEEIRLCRERNGRGVEYQAFEMYFIEQVDYGTIAERLNTGKNTPRRWVANIVNELSPMLWGIEEEM